MKNRALLQNKDNLKKILTIILCQQGYDKYSISLSHSATVDLFFAISGLHTFYHGFESTKKGGCFYLICSLIIRWLR